MRMPNRDRKKPRPLPPTPPDVRVTYPARSGTGLVQQTVQIVASHDLTLFVGHRWSAHESFNLPPTTCVAGLPMLMAHDQDSNAAFKISIYDQVRKNLQRECSSSSRRWRSEAGVFNQELGDTFKFFEKTFSDHGASLFAVKIQSAGNIMLRSRVERVGHR